MPIATDPPPLRDLKLTILFGLQSAGLLARYPLQFPFGEVLRDFPAWLASNRPGANALDDERPWVAFSVIRLLKDIVGPQTRVFEYGSGGSTLFFARHAAAVVTIEHDQPWFEKVRCAMAARGIPTNLLRWVPPEPKAIGIDAPTGRGDPADPRDFVSMDDAYRNLSFQAYANSIDEYADGSFDIVLIDGRARPSCFAHALPKVKRGGWLLLDNTSRSYYLPVTHLADGQFKRRVVRGPAPYSIDFDETTVFQRRL